MAEVNQGRSDSSALLNEEVVRVLTSRLPEASSFLSLGTRLPNVKGLQQRVPVLSVLPMAYFLNAGQDYSDTRRKKTTKAQWANKYLNMEELAVIVPMPIASYEDLRDNGGVNITEELIPYIVQAIGAKIDAAVYHGTDKPNAWPTAIVPGAVAKGKTVTLGAVGDLYDDILSEGGVISLLEEDGFDPNGFVGSLSMKSKLRGVRDGATGVPIFSSSAGMQGTPVYALDGSPMFFPKNGAFDKTKALMIAGDWSEVVYAIRQDIRVERFDTGVIQDTSTGDIAYNLLQDDMIAIRVTMRLGWEIPNPVNATNPDNDTRYPFAVLRPVNPS